MRVLQREAEGTVNRQVRVANRDDQLRGTSGGEGAVATLRHAVFLVASDVVHAVRAARTYSAQRVRGRPVALVVAHPGRVGEPVTIYAGRRRLPPELAAVAGRARRVLRRAGLEAAVLSTPYVDSADGATRSRRITTALLEATRRFRASAVVLDEFAYWEPEAPRVAAGLRRAAETGRLDRAELVVTGVPATHGSRSTPPTARVPSSPAPAIPTARAESDQPAVLTG